MLDVNPLYSISLTAVYFITFVLVLAGLGSGYLFGRQPKRLRNEMGDSSIGSAVAATLGLLAFMLAFTFNMTAERFGQRKAALLDEVNAIGTTFLRTDFLSADSRQAARKLLAQYAGTRDFNAGEIDAEELQEAIVRSEAIQRQLWRLVEEELQQGYDILKLRAFYEPLNQMIDLHTTRLQVGLEYQVPPAIWAGLYAITVLAMFGIGFQLGTSGSGSPQAAVALALAFSLVILLIADLDRAGEGMLVVDQSAMSKLAASLRQAAQ